MTLTPHFVCKCKSKKEFELTFDGGSTGKYVLELCTMCRKLENNEFLIEDDSI